MLKLELPEQMIMVIASALGNHPYREAAPVITEIQKQIAVQQQAPSINGKMGQQETKDVRNRAEH